MRYIAPIALAVFLSGCGLAETASTTAALAEAEAQQAKAAKEAQAKIEKGLQDAQHAAEQQRNAGEAAGE
jgi:ABC-type uncharacterized transport system auxiliary subunit